MCVNTSKEIKGMGGSMSRSLHGDSTGNPSCKLQCGNVAACKLLAGGDIQGQLGMTTSQV